MDSLAAVKRLVPLIATAALLGGCGSAPGPQQKGRAAFIKAHSKLHDDELARLCPGLFPSDYLSAQGPKKYGYAKTKKPLTFTPQQQSAALRVPGCKGPGTRPTN
jgi:hypothetical protein